MLLELFIALEVTAVLMLVLSMVRINDYRNWMLSFIACILFFFIALQSFQIQTENCRSLVLNSTSIGNTTSYGYGYDCQVNTFKDTTLSYVNIALGIISLVYGIGNIFIKNWNTW